jgi:peptidoglycan hydrolase-like protein with peptidoglycan-binding domain
MKHLLNDLSEEEKNRIREQHTGGKKIVIENFDKLVNTKLGDTKPLLSEQTEEANITKSIQCFLNKKMNAGIAVDGMTGPGTNKAIANYQSKIGVMADGVWGDETRSKMPPADKTILEECVNEHSDIIDKVLRWFGL